MRELNIEFQEQYKALDKLCKDLFKSQEGVSAYIREMDITPIRLQQKVYNWESIYKGLKYIRWMRNQLAHERSINEDFCEVRDIEFIKCFYSDILHYKDPLAVAFKEKDSTRIKSEAITQNKPQKKSLWRRIVETFKNWFS